MLTTEELITLFKNTTQKQAFNIAKDEQGGVCASRLVMMNIPDHPTALAYQDSDLHRLLMTLNDMDQMTFAQIGQFFETNRALTHRAMLQGLMRNATDLHFILSLNIPAPVTV